MRTAVIWINGLAPLVGLGLWWHGFGIYGLAGVFVAHMAALWATLNPSCRWWGPQQLEFAPEGQHVWLTIDDGPDPEDTPALLDALDAYHAKATFFLIGEKVARWPELARGIVARGHTVGHHTMTHPHFAFWRLGPGQLSRELDDAAAVYRDVLGRSPTIFRAPAGMRNPFLHPLLGQRGLPLVGWTVRGLDGRDTDRDRIVRRITTGVRPGAILLLHEGRRDGAGRSLAQDCVPRVLSELTRRGYRFVIPSSQS